MAEGYSDGDMYYDGPPRYWVIPVGVAIGCLVVFLFEWRTQTITRQQRLSLYSDLIHRPSKGLDAEIKKKVERNVDGIPNIMCFWSGSSVIQTDVSRDRFTKIYEMLALTSALMLTVCVAFYVENEQGNHIFGIVSCLANCALWMATLSSTLFAAVIHCMPSDDHLKFFISLYGSYSMKSPMMLFLCGTVLIFIEFVFFFKMRVDPGFPCSICLASCLVLFPLFFHALHKIGWAANVVHETQAVETRESINSPLTVEDFKDALRRYAKSKGNRVLNMDKSEFLIGLPESIKKKVLTSVEKELASQLFDLTIQNALTKLQLDTNSNNNNNSSMETEKSESIRVSLVTPVDLADSTPSVP